jgi:hypothetical protein
VFRSSDACSAADGALAVGLLSKRRIGRAPPFDRNQYPLYGGGAITICWLNSAENRPPQIRLSKRRQLAFVERPTATHATLAARENAAHR